MSPIIGDIVPWPIPTGEEMNTDHVRISVNPDVQQRYERMRDAGESHAMAEMLALRRFPAVRGLDSDFNKGQCNGNQFENVPDLGDYNGKLAEDGGVNTTVSVYV